MTEITPDIVEQHGLSEEEYAARKKECYEAQVQEVIEKVIPDFRPHVTYVDCFSPTTITRFTSHDQGAVYGAPEKVKDGRTHHENLCLTGTAHGVVAILAGADLGRPATSHLPAGAPTASRESPTGTTPW